METVVTPGNLGFLAALVIFFVTLVTVFVVYARRARRADANCQHLLSQLKALDRDAIALLAHDILDNTPCHLDSEEIWPLIGGLEGLEALQHNCAVLIELAFHVQKWYPEALVIAEQLRRNAREIEWHIERLRGAAKTGNLQTAFPDYAQRAVTTYFLMTQTLLELYERSGLPEFPELQKAI